MSNYRFNIPLSGGVALAETANRVVSYLTGQGYSIKRDNRPKETTFERKGSYLSMKDHRGPHELKVSFSQSALSLDFKVASFFKDSPSENAFKEVADRVKEEVVKRCPSCAEYIRADASVCRFCQKSL